MAHAVIGFGHFFCRVLIDEVVNLIDIVPLAAGGPLVLGQVAHLVEWTLHLGHRHIGVITLLQVISHLTRLLDLKKWITVQTLHGHVAIDLSRH